jgi:hypothetical protein
MATDIVTLGRVGPLLQRILREYQAMPGLQLTRAQFCRLCHTEPVECESALRILVAARFLRQDDRGQFCRPFDALG